MQGSGNDQMRGIVPRSIEKMLSKSQVMLNDGWQIEMRVSFLEIYNECIRSMSIPDSMDGYHFLEWIICYNDDSLNL